MKTNHVNIVDNSGRIFCYRLSTIIKSSTNHYVKECGRCPYFHDTAGMKGVECLYDDGSNIDLIQFRDSVEAERYSRQLQVKQGIISQEEADNMMVGFDDQQTPVDHEPDDTPEESEKDGS